MTSRVGRVAKRAAIASALAGGVGAGAYGVGRFVAARLRGISDDADAERLLDEPMWVSTTVPSFDGGTINVIDRQPPKGTPVQAVTFVLSHGVTLSARTWLRQLDSLPAAGFRTVAFDHRGHGASKLGTAGHSIDNLGDDVRTVLEDLDLHNVVLVGHSMGGIAVQSYFARHAESAHARVAGLVLLSTLARTIGGSQAAQLNALMERLTRRTPDTTRIWASRNLGLVLARVGFGRDPKPSHVELVRRMMLACPPATRVSAPRSLVGFDLSAGLAQIRVPTLVICGTHDVITPLHNSRYMARWIDGARLEVMEGGGHMLMLERTEAVDRLLVDFAHEVADDAPVARNASR